MHGRPKAKGERRAILVSFRLTESYKASFLYRIMVRKHVLRPFQLESYPERP